MTVAVPTTTVEAISLSSITNVASNPPLHPQAPVPPPGLPLILYIARVPGSRDVFLTPMKPRDRVVTAEDIQSSLYYVHVNCEDDLRSVEPSTPTSPVNSNPTPVRPINGNSIRRKPVDENARHSISIPPPYSVQDPLVALKNQSPTPPRSPRIARKPVLSNISNGQTPDSSSSDLPDIPRRPLPNPGQNDTRRQSLHADNVQRLRQMDHSEENNPYIRDYQSPTNSTFSTQIKTEAETDTLTLIRRDPGSSEQWNVASIRDPPVHEISSSALIGPIATRRTKKSGAPLYLDITNPGYSHFINNTALRSDSRTSVSTSSSDGSAPEGVFRRRMFMPGSRYGEHGYGHRKQKSSDSTSSFEMRRSMRDRSLAHLPGDAPPTTDRRTRGYAFASPWDGKCEFTTGKAGQSLKCRHSSVERGVQDVSELRFNLPLSVRNSIAPMAAGDKRMSSYFSNLRFRKDNDDDDDEMPTIVVDEDGCVDLTLGQERAGGGFRGKQAKLGKLIIEPEGLKMLDLLVAANVGLWWRAYERA